MTLFDAKVRYFSIPKTVLMLNSKTSIMAALEVYRGNSTQTLQYHQPSQLSYRTRQSYAIQRELVDKGILIETDAGLQLRNLDTKADSEAASIRVVLPFNFDYGTLTLTALKIIIACHSLSRYGRRGGLLQQQYFTFSTTHAALATKARVAERGVSTALKQLEAAFLLKTERIRKAGSKTARVTRITLLEPGSGIELSFLGDYFLEQARRIPVHARYVRLLSHLDPRNRLKDIQQGVENYKVYCPICSCRSATFQFNSTEEGDYWRCFNCRRYGKSEFLWAKYSRWDDYTDWKKIMSDNVVAVSALDSQLEVVDGTVDTAFMKEIVW